MTACQNINNVWHLLGTYVTKHQCDVIHGQKVQQTKSTLVNFGKVYGRQTNSKKVARSIDAKQPQI